MTCDFELALSHKWEEQTQAKLLDPQLATGVQAVLQQHCYAEISRSAYSK